MPVIEERDFESTHTVVMDAFDVLKPRVARDAIAWPMDDDTAGPACLPFKLDENDLVPLTLMERIDAHLDALPPLAVWSVFYGMISACALCAAIIALLLCLPAPN